MQGDDSLAHRVLMKQKENKYPGLVKECEQIIKELKILNPFDHWMSTIEWKNMVKNAISEANSSELKSEITEKYKKLKNSELAKEEFGRKEYVKNLDLQ